ncbi:MAG: hypothetical protein HYX94_05890, partial [Chloroflexi bacterium]|nr:hypothetical protein [Chloroflexota bacterium]
MEETSQPILQENADLESIDMELRLLRQDILGGKHWFAALLEAVGRWRVAEEMLDGRDYCYLVGGEAFDWLLLAERLTDAVADLVPEEERESLLFYGRMPDGFCQEQFRETIGPLKYRGYLNYLYGITVEEALILATEEEVHKEQRVRAYKEDVRVFEDAYQRVYGQTQSALLGVFREHCGFSHNGSVSLCELKHFTYWLFKYRVKRCHKARVASDTRKALAKLQGFQGDRGQG